MNSIAEARDFYGLSQRALAEKVKISPAAMNYIEAGKHIPSVYIAQRISRALHKNVDELFWEDEDERRRVY